MRVPLLDLEPEYREVEAEVLEAVRDVVGSRRFILGPRVEELEERIAQYCGCSYAVAVSSGTDALLLSLMALGVGPGDFVVTTPFTFFATAGAIARTGARPLFVDIEAESYNMDPQALKRLVHDMDGERKTRIKAVVPVHLYGRCADMDAIAEVTESLDIGLVEDAAQAIGAEYR
ncbi:MAG: transcriptional regulator, partial [Deltaproteobacteria bacterium]